MTETREQIVTRVEAWCAEQERQLLGPGDWVRVNRIWGGGYEAHYEQIGSGAKVVLTLPRRTDYAKPQTVDDWTVVRSWPYYVVLFKRRGSGRLRRITTPEDEPVPASRYAARIAKERGLTTAGWREYGLTRVHDWPVPIVPPYPAR